MIQFGEADLAEVAEGQFGQGHDTLEAQPGGLLGVEVVDQGLLAGWVAFDDEDEGIAMEGLGRAVSALEELDTVYALKGSL